MNALHTLLAALTGSRAGDYVTADTWRDQADLAQLTSAERAAALVRAADDGYLTAVCVNLAGERVHLCVPTTHAAGKGRRVLLWQRTPKPLPGQRPAPAATGQVDLLDLIGGAA